MKNVKFGTSIQEYVVRGLNAKVPVVEFPTRRIKQNFGHFFNSSKETRNELRMFSSTDSRAHFGQNGFFQLSLLVWRGCVEDPIADLLCGSVITLKLQLLCHRSAYINAIFSNSLAYQSKHVILNFCCLTCI